MSARDHNGSAELCAAEAPAASRPGAGITIHPQIASVYEALKSECDLRGRLLETSTPSERMLAEQAVASRLLTLSKAWRVQPDKEVSSWLSRPEWEALWCQIHQLVPPPRTPPTVRRAVGWIAQLGGNKPRNGDEPEPAALWRGLHRLNDFASMWRLCRGQTTK